MDSVVETLKQQLKSGKIAVKFVNVDWKELLWKENYKLRGEGRVNNYIK